MLLPTLPLWSLVTPDAWRPPERSEAAATVLGALPAGSSVETDIGLMSYVVDHHDVYWLGNDNPAPDCVLIDRVAGGTPSEWGGAVDVATRRHPGVSYRAIADQGGYELACR